MTIKPFTISSCRISDFRCLMILSIFQGELCENSAGIMKTFSELSKRVSPAEDFYNRLHLFISILFFDGWVLSNGWSMVVWNHKAKEFSLRKDLWNWSEFIIYKCFSFPYKTCSRFDTSPKENSPWETHGFPWEKLCHRGRRRRLPRDLTSPKGNSKQIHFVIWDKYIL